MYNSNFGFERVTGYDSAILPTRADVGSAGYDIRILKGAKIYPGKSETFETGIKAYMPDNIFLDMRIRSSIGIKRSCNLSNSPAVIDASYYNNPDNEGHILVAIHNFGEYPVEFVSGERVCQGIFMAYLHAETDEEWEKLREKKRLGGIGSSGTK